jgi:hypothetical protein
MTGPGHVGAPHRMSPQRRRAIAAATLITAIAAALPAVADAATAPLQAARGGAIHALTGKKVAFSLPGRFMSTRATG